MIDITFRNKLLQLAQRLAEEHSWPWQEPVEVSSSLYEKEPIWMVRTNVVMRGSNVHVMFRKSDLQIVHSAYLPR